jgi:hypothetical protein
MKSPYLIKIPHELLKTSILPVFGHGRYTHVVIIPYRVDAQKVNKKSKRHTSK